MNISFFLRPKAETAYLYNDITVRQAVEKMHHYGFTAIPVIDREGHYLGTVTEGDLLWEILRGEGGELVSVPVEKLEDIPFSRIPLRYPAEKFPPVNIMASVEELLLRVLNQNFIAIVDDRDVFIGIVPRSVVIKYFYDNSLKGGDIADICEK